MVLQFYSYPSRTSQLVDSVSGNTMASRADDPHGSRGRLPARRSRSNRGEFALSCRFELQESKPTFHLLTPFGAKGMPASLGHARPQSPAREMIISLAPAILPVSCASRNSRPGLVGRGSGPHSPRGDGAEPHERIRAHAMPGAALRLRRAEPHECIRNRAMPGAALRLRRAEPHEGP